MDTLHVFIICKLTSNIFQQLVKMLEMFLLFLVASVHCECGNMQTNFSENEVFIQNGNFGMYLLQSEGFYQIYVMDTGVGGVNDTMYSYPIESELHLTYSGDFTINGNVPNVTSRNGMTIPPLLLQKLLSPYIISINSPVEEEVQLCYEFTSERTSLKAAVALLVLLFLASHVTKISAIIRTLEKDILRPEFSRRFSRTRSPVARSQTSDSSAKEGSSI